MNAADYFAARTVVTESGCWEWSLSRDRGGYGRAKIAAYYSRQVGAHRLSYEVHIGPIPEGLTVDHLCFNPPCVNPSHLRLLTLSENARNQRDAYKTHCKRGHELTPENTRIKDGNNGKRDCKTCHRDRERAARWRRTAHLPRLGTARGERNPNARLTEADVLEVWELYRAGESISAIARSFEVSRGTVQGILRGRTWAHIKPVGDAA